LKPLPSSFLAMTYATASYVLPFPGSPARGQ
jgi:hypothetical protein